jgi:glycosyltransferase involved in cell wall biosynthesis
MPAIIILVSHHTKPVTGAHYRFDRLARRFLEKGYNVNWLSPKRSEFDKFKNLVFMETINKKKWLPVQMIQLISAVFHFRYLVKMRKQTGVVLSFGETNLFASILVSYLALFPLSIGVRSNITEVQKCQNKHNFIANMNKKIKVFFLKRIWGICYRRASQIITQTYFERNGAIINFKLQPKRVDIVENDIPESSIVYSKNLEPLPLKPKRFLFVGSQNELERKGWYFLYDCLPALKQAIPLIQRLTLVNVPESEILKLKQNNYGFEIRCYPYVSNLLEIMSKHDVVLMPSFWDPFPNVALEAMGLGIPIVGSNTPGLAAILKDKRFLFKTGCQFSFLHCLKEIANKEGYKAAKNLIQEKKKYFLFDWESVYIDTVMSAVIEGDL